MTKEIHPLILRRLLAEIRAAVPRKLNPDAEDYLPLDQTKAAEYRAQLLSALQSGRVQASLRRAAAQQDLAGAADVLRQDLKLRLRNGLDRSGKDVSSSILVSDLISGLGIATGLSDARPAKQYDFAWMLWGLAPGLILCMLLSLGEDWRNVLPDWAWIGGILVIGLLLLLFTTKRQMRQIVVAAENPLGFDYHFAVNAVELYQLVKRDLAAELAEEERRAWNGGKADAQRHLAGVLTALRDSTNQPGIGERIEHEELKNSELAQFHERIRKGLPASGLVDALKRAASSGAVKEEDFVARAGHAFGVCDGPQFYSPEIMTYRCLMHFSAGKLMMEYSAPRPGRKTLWKDLFEWPLLQILLLSFVLLAAPILIWREPLERFMLASQTNNYLVVVTGLLLFVATLALGLKLHPGFNPARRMLKDNAYAVTLLSILKHCEGEFAADQPRSPLQPKVSGT